MRDTLWYGFGTRSFLALDPSTLAIASHERQNALLGKERRTDLHGV